MLAALLLLLLAGGSAERLALSVELALALWRLGLLGGRVHRRRAEEALEADLRVLALALLEALDGPVDSILAELLLLNEELRGQRSQVYLQ